jgi:hypothetical protein
VDWGVYAFWLGWTVAMREAMRSKRWSVENKVVLAMVLGPALGWLFAVSGLAWLFTGRGRRLRHVLGHDRVLVIPFGRGLSPELRAHLDELRARTATP